MSGQRDGGAPHAPTTDAGGGDAGVAEGGADAGASLSDSGPGSESPPTPVDDTGQPIPAVDAGTNDDDLDAGPVAPRDAGVAPMDAGSAAVDAGPMSACAQGRALGGYCWFLGEVNQSCRTVCAAHGGVVSSLDYIGSYAQGGSLRRCDAVLTLLTAEGDTTAGTRDDGRGVGCHLFDGRRWWLYQPNFSSTAYHSHARLACSCLDP